MLRALWLFGVLSVVTLAALWLADREGAVTIAVPDAEYKLSLAAALFLLVALIAVCIFTYRLFSWLGVLPDRLSLWGEERRRKKGFLALTKGLVAAAAGDSDDARRQSKKALSLVGEPPLALLLAAQTAQLEGNEAATDKYFTAMLQSPDMEFLGLRGLFMAASRKGDNDRALELATRAFSLRPKAPWVVNALFDLQTQKHQWALASSTLDAAGKAKLLDNGVTRRRRAVLRAAQAHEAEDHGDGAKALALAQEALAIAPGLTPAALSAARLLSSLGRHWKASAILEQAWAKEPHPEIARAYADLKPDEPMRSRSWRLSGLAAQKPDHPESRILSASVALASGDWQSAKESMRPFANAFPSARMCTMMADIERHAGNESDARIWAQRSVKAPRDAVWACASCARQYGEWTALCAGCGAFDTLTWLSGSVERVTKLPQDDGISGAQADTGDMGLSLYRDAVKRDPNVVMKPPSPQYSGRSTRDDDDPNNSSFKTVEPVIFTPQPAPDDPGPGVREWDEVDSTDASKRGTAW